MRAYLLAITITHHCMPPDVILHYIHHIAILQGLRGQGLAMCAAPCVRPLGGHRRRRRRRQRQQFKF